MLLSDSGRSGKINARDDRIFIDAIGDEMPTIIFRGHMYKRNKNWFMQPGSLKWN